MRRGSILALVGLGIVFGAIATMMAIYPPWLPDAASREAGRIHFVFWFTVGICILVFAVVFAALAYAIVKFRADPDDDSDGPPVHGHTGLEILWTIIPTVLVTAIGIVSAVVLARDDHQPKGTMPINVTAQQFAWTFSYPNAHNMTTGILRVPVNTSIELTFTSKDVIHSFWVPQWSQKQDTVPGIHPTLHITPDKVGQFEVICTELCGLGHAVMRTYAIVMPKAAFAKWLKGETAATTSPNTAVSGAAVFKNNQCGSCHTLSAAKSTGTIGPDLDKLPTYANKAGQPLEQFVSTSITDPSAYVEKGFPDNVMPHTFSSLPKDQLSSLVQYLIQSSKKG